MARGIIGDCLAVSLLHCLIGAWPYHSFLGCPCAPALYRELSEAFLARFFFDVYVLVWFPDCVAAMHGSSHYNFPTICQACTIPIPSIPIVCSTLSTASMWALPATPMWVWLAMVVQVLVITPCTARTLPKNDEVHLQVFSVSCSTAY